MKAIVQDRYGPPDVLELRDIDKGSGIGRRGRVAAVGSNVKQFHPGDAVFGWCNGTLAEYACAAAHRFLPDRRTSRSSRPRRCPPPRSPPFTVFATRERCNQGSGS